MITRRELRQHASRQGVSLGALEKEYVLTLIVQQIYAEENWRQTLIFKGGAALMRRTPRDYFDLWLIFRQDGIAFDTLPELVRAKLRAVGHPYNPDRLWESADVLERLWDADLGQLMRDVPPFSTMCRELQVLFRRWMPETL